MNLYPFPPCIPYQGICPYRGLSIRNMSNQVFVHPGHCQPDKWPNLGPIRLSFGCKLYGKHYLPTPLGVAATFSYHPKNLQQNRTWPTLPLLHYNHGGAGELLLEESMVRVRRAAQRSGLPRYIIMSCNIIRGRGEIFRHIVWQLDIEDLSFIKAVSNVWCPFLVLLPF